jgi:hypothetical protein
MLVEGLGEINDEAVIKLPGNVNNGTNGFLLFAVDE